MIVALGMATGAQAQRFLTTSPNAMHALFWIAAAILIGLFFPAVGAFMLNPFGAVLIAVLIVGIAGEVAGDESA